MGEYLHPTKPHHSHDCPFSSREICPNLRHWNKSAIAAVKAQIRIQVRLGVHADDRRRLHALRNHLDIAQFEVLARRLRVAFEDDGFGVGEVGQADVVPAWL